jgi:phosphatidylserine decarboxylase
VHQRDRPFTRGAQKSVFKFGGSAVVLFGQRGRWSPADDILRHTSEGMETYLRLGEVIAKRN